MTLPVTPAPVDPFGLWQPPRESDAVSEDLSFSPSFREGETFRRTTTDVIGDGDLRRTAGLGPSSPPSPYAIWSLALTTGPEGQPDADHALDLLERQVRFIEDNLTASLPRVEALLSARSRARETAGVSFSNTVSENAPLPPPEAGLESALNLLEPTAADSTVSFSLPAGLPAGFDWQVLYQRLTTLLESVNQQISHVAWVQTTLDGRLVARTTVSWGGDYINLFQPGLSQDLVDAHSRSLELAIAERLAGLRSILVASQIAAKITLALTTPLGPLQAMSLAWQFINQVISQSGTQSIS